MKILKMQFFKKFKYFDIIISKSFLVINKSGLIAFVEANNWIFEIKSELEDEKMKKDKVNTNFLADKQIKCDYELLMVLAENFYKRKNAGNKAELVSHIKTFWKANKKRIIDVLAKDNESRREPYLPQLVSIMENQNLILDFDDIDFVIEKMTRFVAFSGIKPISLC